MGVISLFRRDARIAASAKELAATHAALEESKRAAGQLEAERHHLHYRTVSEEWQHRALASEIWGPAAVPPKAPRDIPESMLPGFSMGGRIPITFEYADDTRSSNHPLIYTDAEIDSYISRIKSGEWSIYGWTDRWLWQALGKYPIRGRSVVNMGSLTPWYEATCIHYGAFPTTIDYNRIIVRSSRMKALTIAEYDHSPLQFDTALSISSFEHDGLGRYGDPLDPDGDLKAMRKMKSIVKPGGLLFLSVPIGADRLAFNAARVYGNLRLPLLIEGWEEIERFGFHEGIMQSNGSAQPIIVLMNI